MFVLYNFILHLVIVPASFSLVSVLSLNECYVAVVTALVSGLSVSRVALACELCAFWLVLCSVSRLELIWALAREIVHLSLCSLSWLITCIVKLVRSLFLARFCGCFYKDGWQPFPQCVYTCVYCEGILLIVFFSISSRHCVSIARAGVYRLTRIRGVDRFVVIFGIHRVRKSLVCIASSLISLFTSRYCFIFVLSLTDDGADTLQCLQEVCWEGWFRGMHWGLWGSLPHCLCHGATGLWSFSFAWQLTLPLWFVYHASVICDSQDSWGRPWMLCFLGFLVVIHNNPWWCHATA